MACSPVTHNFPPVTLKRQLPVLIVMSRNERTLLGSHHVQ